MRSELNKDLNILK